MEIAKYTVTVDTSKGLQMAEKLSELVMAGVITEAKAIQIFKACVDDLYEVVYK
jgi:hypothetical protein